jgi:transcriptional regulator with XRE-family HTH domain
MSRNPLNELGSSLGDYLREQRQSARLSLRQLSELAGISNPYLSQIERGLKRPSAEILKELAKGLEVSAESLYVKAGILDEEAVTAGPRSDVRRAIAEDPALTARQKASLLDFYESFVGKDAGASTTSSTGKTSTTGKTRSTTKRKTSGSTPATTRTTKEK